MDTKNTCGYDEVGLFVQVYRHHYRFNIELIGRVYMIVEKE